VPTRNALVERKEAVMSSRVLSVLALVLGSAVAFVVPASSGAVGAVGLTSVARPFVTYDSVGDAGGLPDITSVAVARDARDRLTFAVNVANRSSPRKGEVVSIGIDKDRRADTGQKGVDVVLSLGWWANEKDPAYSVERWDGSDWQTLEVPALVTYPDSGLRFVVVGSEIGVGRSFGVAARAGRLAGSATREDRVPSTGFAQVALRAPAAIAEISRVMLPGPLFLPEAGKVLRVRGIQVELSGNDEEAGNSDVVITEMVKPERLRCTAKLGDAQLPPVAACAWRMPITAGGKTVMLKVTLAYHGDEWTQVYPLKIG
jgi:hypothetical protein